MSCNSESRRAINYSLQEPINNKYDLWLSENLRYNSEGTLIYDSPGQPACDLILKIYKDGDWKPIAGLSTDHIVANKINIVDGVNYTYISPNDNVLHINNGFLLNHLPLFRNPNDSPNELFDAGTLGNAIYGFVTESEWYSIFEGDNFSDAFEQYFPTIINNGDININDFIELANTEQIGGIKADIHNSYTNAFKPVECKFYPNYGSWSLIHERLCINARDVIDSIIESFSDPDENWLFGNHGITVGLQLDSNSNRIEFAVDGLGNATNGQYARCKITEGVSRHTIEWVDLPEIQTYELLGQNSSASERYVVKGGSDDKHFLNGNGEWTVPEIVEYSGENLIDVNNTTHNIAINITNAEDSNVIICDSGVAKWGAVPNPVINSVDIDDNDDNLTLEGFTLSNLSKSFIVDDEETQSSYEISTWTYYDLYHFKSFTIENAPDAREPIYIRVQDATGLTCSCNYIDAQNVLASPGGKDILITLQFGIAKFEEISTSSQLSELSEP